ncbi:ABC transporter ATP-binding protein [Candidatus Bathyarchaeota archaeon]|nr:MAG: ABC transporter ATP-binding protein [Candidatus Hecatellales archaeon ex4484_218]RJX15329.1 MAG: ABC transporter ATP-binding protein [Candidatus Bathyarchaeota archaeon]
MENSSNQKSGYAAETINLTKIYKSNSVEVYALQNVNLKIRRGEFVAVVGPSGSGKSTLLNLLGVLDKPTSGHVLIDGVDTSTLNSVELAKLRNEKIGFIFQAYNLINRTTVLRNVELPAVVKGVPKEERIRRAKELLELMGLGDKLNRKPLTLSGGEQQRVAIARALINNPTLILGDEPTGNVDSKTGYEIFDLLRKLSREHGATIVVVTHNLELAKLTDRIVYLRDGKIEDEKIMGEI